MEFPAPPSVNAVFLPVGLESPTGSFYLLAFWSADNAVSLLHQRCYSLLKCSRALGVTGVEVSTNISKPFSPSRHISAATSWLISATWSSSRTCSLMQFRARRTKNPLLAPYGEGLGTTDGSGVLGGVGGSREKQSPPMIIGVDLPIEILIGHLSGAYTALSKVPFSCPIGGEPPT